jgi:hypothetical protein
MEKEPYFKIPRKLEKKKIVTKSNTHSTPVVSVETRDQHLFETKGTFL